MVENRYPDYFDTSGNPRWRWRRTVIGGDICRDDWCLYNGEGETVARIRREEGGPNDNRWRWSVQVGPDGRPRNGGTGYVDTGTQAREECEARVPGAREALGRAP